MSRRRLVFEKTARTLYVADRLGYRYEVDYRRGLSSWRAVVYVPGGSELLGISDTLDGAQKLAQSHQEVVSAL